MLHPAVAGEGCHGGLKAMFIRLPWDRTVIAPALESCMGLGPQEFPLS